MQYKMNGALKNASQHTASIGRLKYNSLSRGLVPDAKSETATVTFIKFGDKTYAVTAGHVIEAFNEIAKDDGHQYQGYLCLQHPGVAILGPFLTPPADYPSPVPDIAICPIDEELPSFIGKTPFEVRPGNDAKWPVPYAVAVGFPTAEKRDIEELHGTTKLALPSVHAVAEGLNSPGTSDQVLFHSELSYAPNIQSLSGLSGGPVFWSNGTDYGLIGFVKEALDITPKEGEETFYNEPKVNFICQRVDHSIIESWFKYIDANWQNAREAINNSLKSSSASPSSS